MDASRHDRMPTVRSAMTAFPYSIRAAGTVEEARRMMAEHDIRHLPVKQGERLVGVVSASDLERAGADGKPPRPVGEVCSGEAFVVPPGRRLDEVLAEMAARHLDSAIVVKDGRLAGIFTMTDACRCFAEFLRSIYPDPGDGRAA